MVRLRRRISEYRAHIILAHVRKIGSDLSRARAARQHLQHVGHAHARSRHDGASAAHRRVHRNPGKACQRHAVKVRDISRTFKRRPPAALPSSTHPRYIPRMTKLSPIESEFATTEEAEAYDAWFRAKIESRLASKAPGIPHDEVMARMQAIIDRRKKG